MDADREMHDDAADRFKGVIGSLLREAVPPLVIGSAVADAVLTRFAEF